MATLGVEGKAAVPPLAAPHATAVVFVPFHTIAVCALDLPKFSLFVLA